MLVIFQSTNGQTYTIPWAEQQPTWIFPIWFEDGNGARDTLYYCVDSMALSGNCLPPNDVIFGEKLISEPAGKFSAMFEGLSVNCTENYKVSVNPFLEYNGNFIGGIIIYLCNAELPLTIRWDNELFYSNKIPLPNLSPAPQAEGLISYDISMNPGDDCFPAPILMTDTVTNPFSCSYQDSVVFTGIGISNLNFRIRPWSGEWVGIESVKTSFSDIQIHPNPVKEILSINYQSIMNSIITISIYDILGREKYILSKLVGNEIDLSFLDSGMYYLKASDQLGFSCVKPFLKI